MKQNRFSIAIMIIALMLVLTSCDTQEVTESQPDSQITLKDSAEKLSGDELEVYYLELGETINSRMTSEDAPYRLGAIEYLTESDEMGRTLYFGDVGNKQLGHHFVPGDPRRDWNPPGFDGISWISDLFDGDAGPGLTETQDAIGRAMQTWENQTCSELPLMNVPDNPAEDLSFTLWWYGYPGSPIIRADVAHAGWIPFLAPPTLAATFTFIWANAAGPTDIDNNGKADTAFREIYYNMFYPWDIDTNVAVDVETVALHESGHGLSQAHFGKLFRTDKNGKFHFAPRAVMNAGYSGMQQSLKGTDNGGHCGIWDEWPNY